MMHQDLPLELVWELLDRVQDIVLCLDAGGTITYANQIARTKFGNNGQALAAKAIQDISPGFPWAGIVNPVDDLSPAPYSSFCAYFENADEPKAVPYEVTIKSFSHQGQMWKWIIARDISQRARVFEALWESEERFKRIFANEALGMAIFSPDGYFVEVSDYLCRLLGYTAWELKGKHFLEITHPDDVNLSLESEHLMLSGEARVSWLEKRYLRKDGQPVWVILSTSIHRDRLGKPLCLISHIQDISARKKAEEDLDETRQLFQNAFEDAAVGMIIFDGAGRFMRVNSYLCQLLGYTEEELQGKHYVDITHPDDIELSVQADQRLVNKEIPFASYEKRYLHKNGTPIWLIVSNSLLHDPKGRPRYFVAHCQDIGQRKKAEQKLRASERRFQLFMNHLPGKAFIKGQDGRYQYGNRFFTVLVEEHLGRNMIGLRDRDIFPGDWAKQMEENERLVLDSGEAREFIEVTNEGPETKHWLTYKFPIEQDDDSILLGGIALDVSARIKAVQELEKRDRELDIQKENLERANTALKVLMEHRQQEMIKKEKDTLATLEKLVLPYLQMIQTKNLDPEPASCLNIALHNLTHVAADFASRLSSKETLLSPAELKVADMLRQGKTVDEIADILCISPYTVARHRAGIRGKLGLTNKKINLRNYLKSLS